MHSVPPPGAGSTIRRAALSGRAGQTRPAQCASPCPRCACTDGTTHPRCSVHTRGDLPWGPTLRWLEEGFQQRQGSTQLLNPGCWTALYSCRRRALPRSSCTRCRRPPGGSPRQKSARTVPALAAAGWEGWHLSRRRMAVERARAAAAHPPRRLRDGLWKLDSSRAATRDGAATHCPSILGPPVPCTAAARTSRVRRWRQLLRCSPVPLGPGGPVRGIRAHSWALRITFYFPVPAPRATPRPWP
jgi:hypothetical protein